MFKNWRHQLSDDNSDAVNKSQKNTKNSPGQQLNSPNTEKPCAACPEIWSANGRATSVHTSPWHMLEWTCTLKNSHQRSFKHFWYHVRNMMVQRKYQEWLKHWQRWQISLYSAKYSVFLAGQSGLTTSCNVSKRAWSGASNPKLLKRTAAPWPARVSGESSSGSWNLTTWHSNVTMSWAWHLLCF